MTLTKSMIADRIECLSPQLLELGISRLALFGSHARDAVDECEFLRRSSAGMSCEAFLADPVLRRACQRSLEIIGEAAKKVDDSFKASHPSLPWRDMAAMRDRLIHGSFGVDDAIVWDVMQRHIPRLLGEIRRLFEKEQEA